MDFFAQQDRARRNTFWLVLLFMAAIAALLLITNLLVTLTLWSLSDPQGHSASLPVIPTFAGFMGLFTSERFINVSLAVIGVVSMAMVYKYLQLAEGGKAVAESLGGKRIQPNSADPDQIRVLNVVEEMALASGIPVPPVYLLHGETAINAFAAGNSPADAVIGVTRGCLEQLNREQLQGVIAHEFSHIFNGDMRLNLRLIALLHGILFIGMIGDVLMRTRHRSRNDKGGGKLALLGLGLVIVGWLGSFFGSLIKASVNRQREFLADAAAVQFTRNPQGIADALKIIGGYTRGSEIESASAAEVSHLFFGRSLARLSGLFATHPPLLERVLRVQPDWDGSYIHRQPRPTAAPVDPLARAAERAKSTRTLTVGLMLADAVAPPPQPDRLVQLPERLEQQARDPLGAVALVYALLLSDDEPVRQQQLTQLDSLPFAGLTAHCQRLRPQLQVLDDTLRLPLVELSLPALKCMSANQYPQFKRGLIQLIRADRRTELFEWCLYQLVRHYLAPEHEPPRPPNNRYHKAQQVADAYRLVLSLLAHQGHQDATERDRAFHRGADSVGLYNLTPLPSDACEVDAFSRALNRLADSQPGLKSRLLRGFELCVKQDGQVTPIERELLTAIAAVMACPVPSLILDKAVS